MRFANVVLAIYLAYLQIIVAQIVVGLVIEIHFINKSDCILFKITLIISYINRLTPNSRVKTHYLASSIHCFDFVLPQPGPRLNMKTVFPRYGNSLVKDKTAARHGDTYTGKTSLYWDAPRDTYLSLLNWFGSLICHQRFEISFSKGNNWISNIKLFELEVSMDRLLFLAWLNYYSIRNCSLISSQALASQHRPHKSINVITYPRSSLR